VARCEAIGSFMGHFPRRSVMRTAIGSFPAHNLRR
jgi:hypothetical protein